MNLFTQILILLVVLACMIMVLLAIRQLTHFEGFDDYEETNSLKNEVEEDNNILSNNNIFSSLVDTDQKKNYKSKDKDPISRSE